MKDRPHFSGQRTREDDIQAEGEATQERERPWCLGKGIDSALPEHSLRGQRWDTRLEGKLGPEGQYPPVPFGAGASIFHSVQHRNTGDMLKPVSILMVRVLPLLVLKES